MNAPLDNPVSESSFSYTWQNPGGGSELFGAHDLRVEVRVIREENHGHHGHHHGSDDVLGQGNAHTLLWITDPCDQDFDLHRSLDCGGLDCDDSNHSAFPGAPELDDAIDQDCDGDVAPHSGWLLVSTSEDRGFTYTTERLSVEGIPVLGATRRTVTQGATRFFQSRTHSIDTTALQTTPTLSPEDAVDAVIASLRDAHPDAEINESEFLSSRVTTNGSSLRVFDADIFRDSDTSPTRLVYLVHNVHSYVVDAHSGQVVSDVPSVRGATSVHEGFVLGDPIPPLVPDRSCTATWGALLPGTLVSSGGIVPGDDEANTVFSTTADMREIFLRIAPDGWADDWDGAGGNYIATVRSPVPAQVPLVIVAVPVCSYSAANAIALGRIWAAINGWDPQIVLSYDMTVPDTVAHEFGHLIIDAKSQIFAPRGTEANALHEAIADVFGLLVDTSNFELGELGRAGAVRDLSDPTASGGIDDYRNFTSSLQPHDGGGVAGKAHFMMIAGGGGFRGYTFPGLGHDKVGAIVMRATESYLNAAPTFGDYAEATIAACDQLRVLGEPVASPIQAADCQSVREAWQAVFVLPTAALRVGCGSGDFTTIQGAIDSLPATLPTTVSTIYVCEGVYDENIVSEGHSIALLGQGEVVIDGGLRGPVIRVENGVLFLSHLTVQNGAPTADPIYTFNQEDAGAGVVVLEGSFIAGDVTVSGNTGVGVYVRGRGDAFEPVLRDRSLAFLSESQVSSNGMEPDAVRWVGGGIHVSRGDLVLWNTEVASNVAFAGGGVFLENQLGVPVDVIIRDSTFIENTAAVAGGGLFFLPDQSHEQGVVLQGSTTFERNSVLYPFEGYDLYGSAVSLIGGMMYLTADALDWEFNSVGALRIGDYVCIEPLYGLPLGERIDVAVVSTSPLCTPLFF